jgi:hypothetical protein
MNYDYSILTEYFPESVIKEFYASAIDPKLCLLNAEFLNGDKAISELLGEVKIHNNNGTLKKGYRDTYASIMAVRLILASISNTLVLLAVIVSNRSSRDLTKKASQLNTSIQRKSLVRHSYP